MKNLKINIVYPPSVTWDVKQQRPHHLLRELSKNGMTAHYIDANINRGSNPICSVKKIKEMSDNFYLYGSERHFECNKPDGINILYAQYPQALKWKNITNFDLIWYDYLDDFPCRREGELEIIKSADVVTASGKYLYDNASKVRNDVVYLSNGCDYNSFSKAKNRLPCPELDNIPKGTPIIGYIGAVAYWFDMNLFNYLVKSFDFAKIVLVGALFNGPGAAVKLPEPVNNNLIFLNSQPYERLPEFLSRFDVAIIPFQSKNEIIRATNPIKLWEYFSAGKPVVATEMPELNGLEPLVRCEDDHFKFATTINEIFKNGDNYSGQRQELARERDWAIQGKKLYNLLLEGLIEKGKIGRKFPGLDKNLVRIKKNRLKKVALICPQFLNKDGEIASYGGAEKYYIELISILQNKFDADVDIYQFDVKNRSQEGIGNIKTKLKYLKKEIIAHFVGISSYQIKISEILERKVKNSLLNMGEAPYDLYIYSSVRAAYKPQHPNIVIYHGVDFDFGDLRFNKDLTPAFIFEQEIKCYDNPEIDSYIGIDTNFSTICKTFMNTDLSKWELIPNAVNLEEFYPPKNIKDKKEIINILFPRFIYKARGSDIAVECARKLTNKYKNVKFYFCGNYFKETDEDWLEVKKAIESNPDQILYKKNIPFEEMAELYRNTDITIIPTHYGEGTSRSAIEALASGNVVLVSWSGGLPDLMIDGFNGFVLPDRANDFIKKLEYVIENINSKEIKTIRNNAIATSKTMDLKDWKQKWAKIFERIIGE